MAAHAPHQTGRKAILEIRTREIPLAEDVDLERAASMTPGMTVADLANLKRHLAAHRTQLEAIAKALLEHESLDEDQVNALAGGAMPAEKQHAVTATAATG